LAQILPPEIAKWLPVIPGVARGTVTAVAKGWTRSLYYDPVSSVPVRFQAPPTIVVIAELREGHPPKISAPTITLPPIGAIAPMRVTVPKMTLPAAPKISIPIASIPSTSITLPTEPSIEVPEPTIDTNPLYALVGYRFKCGYAVGGICDGLNKLMELWDKAIDILIDAVDTVNAGFKKARKALLDLTAHIKNLKDNTEASINTGLKDARDKAQAALDTYRDNIQTSINEGLADTQAKTQQALDAYAESIESAVNMGFWEMRIKANSALSDFRKYIEGSINTGLSDLIPKLYEMMGLEIGQLMSPINIRNVTTESFDFYALSPGMKVHYLAVGQKALA